MSNFSESHKIINKEIVTNGEGEITGEVMNDVLNTMLDDTKSHIDNLEERILITTSCKASVKANTKLSIWQMEDIIKKWRTTKMPYTCPHGRPIAKTIPHKELAGFFQRAK